MDLEECRQGGEMGDVCAAASRLSKTNQCTVYEVLT